MGRALSLLFAVALAAACSDRAEPGPAPREVVRDAVTPFADALQLLQRQQQLDSERAAGIAAELRSLGTWLHGVVPDAERARLRELTERMTRLEQELAAAKARQEADQQLLLRAVEASIDRLEALLRRLPAAPAPADPDKRDAGSGGALDRALWLLLLVPLTLWLARRRRGRPLPPPEVPAATAATAAPPAPRVVRVRLKASDPGALIEPLLRRLECEPLVVIEPAPQLRASGDELSIEFHVAGFAVPEIDLRVEAELLGLAREAAPRGRRGAA
jgi:hypothetical protein